MHRLLVGGLAVAFARSLGDSAWADSHEPSLEIFSATEEDFALFETADGNAEVAALMASPLCRTANECTAVAGASPRRMLSTLWLCGRQVGAIGLSTGIARGSK